MREGWERVELGSVTQQVEASVPVRRGASYRLLGVSAKARGVFGKDVITSESTKAKQFTPVRAGQFIYNRLFAGTGSFGVVPVELDESFVSNEFPVFNVDPMRLDVHYLGLWFQRPECWEQVAAECVGTTGSRMRWKENRFNAFPIALPPLAEQRRIVDLIAALDESVARGTRLIEIAEEALASFLRFSFGNNGYDAVPVDHLLVRNIGGVWGAEPGADEVDVRVYRSTEFTRIGHLVESGGVTRAITRRQLDSRQLLQGDILLEKSGGGPNQPVGRVVRVKEVPDRSICANFVQLITADASKVDPGYLFYALFARHQLGVTEQYQRRTTGIRNLQTKEYLALTVGVPPVAEQRRVVMTADAFDDLRASAENAVERLRVLRQGLIADLLSGAHEIPESYDALLDMTA